MSILINKTLTLFTFTVKPVLSDHPFCISKLVSQDRWSLITGCAKNHVSIIMNMHMLTT